MNIHQDILTRDLKKHTQALALPLGRKVGSPGHDVTREYLLNRMRKSHLVPFRGDSFELCYERPHPNTKQPQRFTNLVGVIPGNDRSLPPILVGAHYDSVIDSPCVDDNATSVAKTLVIAEAYALRPLERDLIIAFLDAEEPPFFLGETMGLRRFCEDYHHPKDDMEWINFDKLAHITRFVGDLIERIDQTPQNADIAPCDPFDTEMRMLRKAIGPALPLGMKYFKIKMPESPWGTQRPA